MWELVVRSKKEAEGVLRQWEVEGKRWRGEGRGGERTIG